MKYIITSILIISSTILMKANNLEITNLTITGNELTFTVSWENSWRSTLEFHDAAWIIVKQAANGGPSWMHANVSTATVDAGYEAVVTDDNVGVLVRRATNGNGTVSFELVLTIDDPVGAFRDYKVFGTEMVYVPQGAYDLGDGWSFGTYYRGDDPSLSYHVTSEDLINHGSTSDDVGGGGYLVDIPANFPKGYAKFYCMKYNITMGQYVDFLNCQSRAAQDSLTNSNLSNPTVSNYFVMSDTSLVLYDNPIRCDQSIGSGNIEFYCDLDHDGIGNEDDDGQFRAVNRIRVRHMLAYLDWAGLGPMTNLEFEKACRGPLPAVAGEYSWGSTLTNYDSNRLNEGTASEKYSNSGILGGMVGFANSINRDKWSMRVGCNAPLTGGSRELSNATYYGILGMSFFKNNVVSIFTGSYYEGQHGDGNLNNGFNDEFGVMHSMADKTSADGATYAETSPNFNKRRVSMNFGNTTECNQTAAGRGVRRL